MLTEWGANDLAELVGADMRRRAESFARSGRDSRDVLRAPFLEEVDRYAPVGAPLSLLAGVSVVVRCSRLEEAHARGIVTADGVEGLTATAAAPLMGWLNENYLAADGRPGGVFEGLDARWPRAWAALEAVAQVPDGGRASYRYPDAPAVSLPSSNEITAAGAATNGSVVLSGIERKFDERAMDLLRRAGPDFVAVVSSLSRLSRDIDKMLRMMEILLSRGSSILTTNVLIRPTEVHVRRGQPVSPDSLRPLAGLSVETGLSRLHRKVIDRALGSAA